MQSMESRIAYDPAIVPDDFAISTKVYKQSYALYAKLMEKLKVAHPLFMYGVLVDGLKKLPNLRKVLLLRQDRRAGS